MLLSGRGLSAKDAMDDDKDKATEFSDVNSDGTPRMWSVAITVVDADEATHEEHTYYDSRQEAESVMCDLRPALLSPGEWMTILLLRRIGSHWCQIAREDFTWQDNDLMESGE